MNAARGGQATHPTPTRASTSAAQNLSPAYPRRAAWGTAGSLRAWQAAALGQYLETMPQDFLAVATPGAGKTTFALRVATELLPGMVWRRLPLWRYSLIWHRPVTT